MIARLAVTIATLLAVLVSSSTARAEPTDGTIDGHITNGTAGAATPVGDDITLLIFGKADEALKDQRTTSVADDGGYSFNGLDRSADVLYVVVAQHAGVAYSSSTPIDLQDTANGHADVQVYETTTSDEGIAFDRLNIVVASTDPGLLHMYEMGTVNNTGDRTFVPADPQATTLAHGLRFSLPHGALGAQVQSGFPTDDLVGAPGGVQVTSPIVPGPHEFALSFGLPYSGGTADLGIQVPYRTTMFNVYAPDGGPRLESDRLQTQGQTNFGARSFNLARAENLTGSENVAARLSGLPSTGGELTPLQIGLAGLGALLVLIGLGALVYGLRVRRRARGSPANVEHERQRLIQQLAVLDDKFEAGRIQPRAYEAARARGKQRLVQLGRTAS
jgi:hypothetical protein